MEGAGRCGGLWGGYQADTFAAEACARCGDGTGNVDTRWPGAGACRDTRDGTRAAGPLPQVAGRHVVKAADGRLVTLRRTPPPSLVPL
jgi:hypothetical protein